LWVFLYTGVWGVLQNSGGVVGATKWASRCGGG
jgi:hypothetical protein